jgi:hypothetical protein
MKTPPRFPSLKQNARKILLILIVFLLAAAIPSLIREQMRTGEFYLFSHQFLEDIISRFTGRGRFRFVIQPLTAILLGIRSGLKDAGEKRPGYIKELLQRKSGLKQALTEGLDVISTLLLMGVLADIIFQLVLFRMVHIVPALILGPILITGPYIISRDLANRLFRKYS